jgi:hypothetical protein
MSQRPAQAEVAQEITLLMLMNEYTIAKTLLNLIHAQN